MRHLQKKPRPSFLLLAFVLRCLYRTVLNRSAADSWVAFGSEGCSLIKKTRQIDLCKNSYRSFWWPRGSSRRSTVTSRGCGAATGWTVRYFRKDQRPVQDFLRSEVAHTRLGQTRFFYKNHSKARGLYKCIHQFLIKRRKESKQLCFSNFSLPWFCLKSYWLCDK